MSITNAQQTREALRRRLSRLARRAVFGSLSETYRTWGRPGCRCHPGHKHGPHLYVSFRGPDGTTGYDVPQALAKPLRQGVAAWQAPRGAAGNGGTEPAAPVGAEGGSRSEEEPWFVVSTRSAASSK